MTSAGSSQTAEPTRVVFAFYERANFRCIRRVMSLLAADPRLDCRFLSGFDFKEHTGQVPPLAVPAELDSAAIADYYPPLASSKPAPEPLPRRRLAELAASAPPGSDRRLALALVQRVLDRDYIPELGAIWQQVAAGLARYCREQRPRLVVLPEDSDYIRGRLAGRLLRAFGIPSVVLTPNYYAMFEDYPTMGEPLADWYLVGHRAFAGRLSARGVPVDRIRVVGHPALDRVGTPSRSAGQAGAGAPASGRGILLALQGLPGEESLAIALHACARRAGQRLLLKAHPDVPSPWIAGWPAEDSWQPVPAGDDPGLWLESASWVVGQSSTVLYEALLLRRRIILLNLSGFAPSIHLPEPLAAVVVARSWAEVSARLASPMDPSRHEASLTALFPNHPRASEAAARAIARIASELPAKSG